MIHPKNDKKFGHCKYCYWWERNGNSKRGKCFKKDKITFEDMWCEYFQWDEISSNLTRQLFKKN